MSLHWSGMGKPKKVYEWKEKEMAKVLKSCFYTLLCLVISPELFEYQSINTWIITILLCANFLCDCDIRAFCSDLAFMHLYTFKTPESRLGWDRLEWGFLNECLPTCERAVVYVLDSLHLLFKPVFLEKTLLLFLRFRGKRF